MSADVLAGEGVPGRGAHAGVRGGRREPPEEALRRVGDVGAVHELAVVVLAVGSRARAHRVVAHVAAERAERRRHDGDVHVVHRRELDAPVAHTPSTETPTTVVESVCRRSWE